MSESRASTLGYASAVFVAALLLLERSADQFVDQVAVLARSTSVSPSLIAVLTAGAEWEELAVVVASLGHGASSLAVGNVVGSAISNILGAFSLGLLFCPVRIRFDCSARRFALLQFTITTLVVALLLLVQLQSRHVRTLPSRLLTTSPPHPNPSKEGPRRWFKNVVGISLVLAFVLYLLGVSWAIGRGMLNAPEDSSDDDDSSSSSDAEDSDAVSALAFAPESDAPARAPASISRIRSATAATRGCAGANLTAAETTPLMLGRATSSNLAHRLRVRRRRTTLRAARRLVTALLVLSLAGFLLSRSTLKLASALHVSDTVLGLTLLSFATTLPEKLLGVIAGRKVAVETEQSSLPSAAQRQSSHRHQHRDEEAGEATAASGVLMAAAAGSNIFLLTLCLGVSLLCDTRGGPSDLTPLATAETHSSVSSILGAELALLEASSAALVAIAYFGGRRWLGLVLMAAYVAFLVAEFTVWKR
ncbi:hypothetical protein ACQY0O_002297 [Thecaphora frezii]